MITGKKGQYMKQFGIIDLGSNSVRLVLYREDETGTIQEMDNVKSVLRLSSHINDRGEIDSEGKEALIECLKRYSQFCKARAVKIIYGIATAAIRSASNQSFLIQEIADETGIIFRVLNGEEEAYYGYLAVINTLAYREAITVDIGGGSTEITYFKDRKLIHSYSFPFGAVTLFQSFREDLSRIKQFVSEQLSSEKWMMGIKCPVIVMGGTARNLARIHQRKINYSLSSLHNYMMNRGDVEETLHEITEIPLEKRKEVNGLSKDRIDILPVGLAVFTAVMELVQSSTLITSNKGIRDGFLFERILAPNHKVLPDILAYSTEQFMKRYRVNREHSEHVAEIAIQLFDQLETLACHTWGERERILLRTAALLHDIGRSINVIESTKHTFYLIENVLLHGVTHRERILIGLIASFKNNRQLVKFASAHPFITKEDELLALQLGTLVLLARQLDRNMDQKVQKIEVHPLKKKLAVSLKYEQLQWMEEPIEDSLKKISKAFARPFSLSLN
ncbi:MAG TPA: Ppx/GppA phosphatase family protein [Bacillota bacterium]|nr:Ppx/GppA phosphatase family protein [Bacillota bacterium]